MGSAAVKQAANKAGSEYWNVLKLQNSKTSQLIIDTLKSEESFRKVSSAATRAVLQRDKEDDAKLARGIRLAVDKGVIPSDVKVEKTEKVDVFGKTADAVAAEIVRNLGDAPKKGCVVVIHGLSGTGKGTTVSKLKEILPKATTWSNGNVFRSLTLLAATFAEQNECDLSKALTPKNLADFCSMLTFDKFGGQFDVRIKGLGLDMLVSQVQNTVLKGPKVGKNIPTVAEVTQGEVIQFVGKATARMAKDGFNVLVEGRAQTLDHLRTPHRFELVLPDVEIIGQRRAAQRIAALAHAKLIEGASDSAAVAALRLSNGDVAKQVARALESLYGECEED